MGRQHGPKPKTETTDTNMIETPNVIVAQLNDAAKMMETNGSTTYFEQVANKASTIIRKIGRARRIVLPPSEPGQDPICIDTSLRTVAYMSRKEPNAVKFAGSSQLPFKTAEAINHYFIDYLEKVARKLK